MKGKIVMSKPKSIYIVENEFGNIKIGVSGNVKSRIKTLSSQGGFKPMREYFTSHCTNAYDIERKCHIRFKKYNIGGEWFSVGFLEAKKYLRKIFKREAKNEVRHDKYNTSRLFDIIFDNATRENKETKADEFLITLCEFKNTMDDVKLSDLQRLKMYETIFKVNGLPTSFFLVAEKEIMEREKA